MKVTVDISDYTLRKLETAIDELKSRPDIGDYVEPTVSGFVEDAIFEYLEDWIERYR